MKKSLAHRVYANAVAAGRVGEDQGEPFNAGVLACLEGRLEGKMPLVCPFQSGSTEYNDFYAGVAEGRELSPVWGAPFGEPEGVEHD